MAFLSVAMPHYNKANNKHDNISTIKTSTRENLSTFIHLYSYTSMQQNYYKNALWHALYCMHRATFVTTNLTYLDLERERDLEREADFDLE